MTDFEQLDEEGNYIEDESEKTKYKGWQKVLFALEALLMLAVVAGAIALIITSPHSHF